MLTLKYEFWSIPFIQVFSLCINPVVFDIVRMFKRSRARSIAWFMLLRQILIGYINFNESLVSWLCQTANFLNLSLPELKIWLWVLFDFLWMKLGIRINTLTEVGLVVFDHKLREILKGFPRSWSELGLFHKKTFNEISQSNTVNMGNRFWLAINYCIWKFI